jgi:translation initiation factor RLI1
MLAGAEKADSETQVPDLHISYKLQKLVGRNEESVRDLFNTKIREMFHHPQFQTDVVNRLKLMILSTSRFVIFQVVSSNDLQSSFALGSRQTFILYALWMILPLHRQSAQ